MVLCRVESTAAIKVTLVRLVGEHPANSAAGQSLEILPVQRQRLNKCSNI